MKKKKKQKAKIFIMSMWNQTSNLILMKKMENIAAI